MYNKLHHSRRSPVRAGVLALILAALAPAAAAQDFDPRRAARLIEQGEPEQAYELAREHRGELEGQPGFDFWYGLAALETDRLSEAIFALERVLLQHPGSERARLELARAYFLSGEDLRARRHFESVLAGDPPAPVRATIERYMQAIQRRADRYTTVISGSVEVGGGYDSNVNSATDADEFDLTIGDIVLTADLDDESREQSDDFARLAAGAELRRPLTPDATFFLAADFEETANEDHDDFDRRLLQARTGSVLHHERGQTRLGLRLQRFYVGGEAYRDLAGLDASTSWRTSATASLNGAVQLAQQTYEDQENRDALLGTVSLGATRIWEGAMRPVTSLSIFAGKEDPDEDNETASAIAERDMWGLTGMLRLGLSAEWNVRAGAQYRRSEYGAPHPFFPDTTREDDYYRLDLAFNWEPTSHWRVGPEVRHTVNDSNVEINEYDRTVLELRARYGF